MADGELNAVDLGFGGPVSSLLNFDPTDPELESTLQHFYDEITGEQLPTNLVSAARQGELK